MRVPRTTSAFSETWAEVHDRSPSPAELARRQTRTRSRRRSRRAPPPRCCSMEQCAACRRCRSSNQPMSAKRNASIGSGPDSRITPSGPTNGTRSSTFPTVARRAPASVSDLAVARRARTADGVAERVAANEIAHRPDEREQTAVGRVGAVSADVLHAHRDRHRAHGHHVAPVVGRQRDQRQVAEGRRNLEPRAAPQDRGRRTRHGAVVDERGGCLEERDAWRRGPLLFPLVDQRCPFERA